MIEEFNKVTGNIIDCAIEVHKIMGPRLLESIYEECLMYEFSLHGIKAERQKHLPLYYKQKKLSKDFCIDLLIEDKIVLELKSIENILPIHKAQLLSYLRLTNKKLGLLINFNVEILKKGLHRVINGYFD